jgi:glyoxylase-like metal-dependent hydrolase (beta-lactamase superfamily II)
LSFHSLNQVTRGAALLVAGLFALPAWAGAPLAKTNAPGLHRFMLGDFEITEVSDGTIDLPVDQLLKESPQKTQAALKKTFLKAPLETSVNAFLINTGKHLILVDAGAGSLFGPTLGKLASNIKASGYKLEDVDEVLVTHLHPDHVGGLTVNGIVQFPNATVHAAKQEADYWLSQQNLDNAPQDTKGFFQGAMASVNPYVKARKLVLFEGDVEVVPGVTSYASPGHTVGHTSYVVRSQGQELLLVGDLIHVPAVQLAHPEVTIAYDTDDARAAASRATVFTDAAKSGVLVGASHMPFPGVGHLMRTGKSYQWVPANYTQLR